MSDYERNKVVRYKPTKANLEEVADDLYQLEEKYPHLFNRTPNCKYFEVAPTEEPFIDFVLEHSYGEECGDFGKIRKLYPTETVKYGKMLEELFPKSGVALYNLRVVDYCFYNGCEAPDYFDETKDDFYDEV